LTGTAVVAAEAGTIRIGMSGTQTNTFVAGIYGGQRCQGTAVILDSSGHLATRSSAARFKAEIKPMDKTSETILALKPVSFRYKKEIDPEGTP
jgi:hypothetical protein